MCAVSMLVGASRNCSRFVCRYGFHKDVLDSDYVPILLYCCTRIQYFALARFYQTRAKGCIETKFRHNECTQHVVTLHGGHVVPSALRSSTASVKAIVVWNSWSRRYPQQMRENLLGTYHPKTESYYIRRHLYKPPGLLYCGGCTWTRISRQRHIAITWHFYQQTLLEPLTVSERALPVSVNDVGMYCTII